MLILVDSGILLRLVQRADPLHGSIRQAIRTLVGRGDEPVLSPQNLAEFWNVCTRPAAARGGLGLDIAETDRRLKVLERLFQVLPEHPATYALWRQLVVTHAVQGRQVHDARLAALMQSHGVPHILTLNGADFARYPASPRSTHRQSPRHRPPNPIQQALPRRSRPREVSHRFGIAFEFNL